jgi:tetratricopeptide (TPR) repeat protein
VSRRRIERLQPATRVVLERASVLDRQFPLSQLVAMAGNTALETLDALDELLRDGLFTEPAPGTLSFAHDRTRETAYGLLPAARLRALHASAAATLEALRPTDAPARRRVAHHFSRSGQPQRASELRLLAGQAAWLAGANHDALADFVAAESGASPSQVCRIGLARGRVLAEMGQLEEAHAVLERVLEGCEQQDIAAGAHVELGYIAYRQGRPDAMLSHAREAQSLARDSSDLELVVKVENVLGIAHGARGYCKQAILHYERAAKVAEALGDLTSAAMRRNNIGINQRLLGQLDEAEATLQAALEQLGDDHPGMKANVLINLARVHLDRRAPARAKPALERAVKLADRTATYGVLDEALFCLGVAALYEGDLDAAEARAQQTIERATQSRQNVQLGCGLRLLASACASRGAAEQARSNFERSVGVLRATGDREELAHSLLAQARHLRECGLPADADAADAEARELFEELDMGWRLDQPGS